MKKIILFTALFIIVTCAITFGQCSSNSPKFIATIPTEAKSKEIVIKNQSKIPEIFIVYRAKNSSAYWEKIGSVSIFSMTEGKFYVEPGYLYAFNVEGERPIKIGSEDEKWKVRDRDREYHDTNSKDDE